LLNFAFAAMLLVNTAKLLLSGSPWGAGLVLLIATTLAVSPLFRSVVLCQISMLFYILGAGASIVEGFMPSPESAGGGISPAASVAIAMACVILCGYMLFLAREKMRHARS